MAGNVFGGIYYNVSTIFAKSHEKSHRLWTKNLSLARGLLALQIKIPLGINFLGPWEGGIWFKLFFFVTLTSPPGQPSRESLNVSWLACHSGSVPQCTAAYCSINHISLGGARDLVLIHATSSKYQVNLN